MKLAVRWKPRAIKDLRRLPENRAGQVAAAIVRFAETGEGDVKRLQQVTPAEFRLRVGDVRIRFAVDHSAGVLDVLRVLPRDKAYK